MIVAAAGTVTVLAGGSAAAAGSNHTGTRQLPHTTSAAGARSNSLVTPHVVTSPLTVKDLNHGATANGLATSLAGSGVTVSDVTYTGANRAAGAFSSPDGTTIGFPSGVVLDSGNVETLPTDNQCTGGVEGPNDCNENTGDDNSTGEGTPGDSDLSALSGDPTFDASVLDFNFVPAHPTVQFSYVFGSDEYSNFSNTQFDDVFGFFVNGTNCALVPGTTDPVSINTINDGNPNGDTTPHNPQFFRDNVNPSPTLNTQLDGLTTVLTCNATVNPGVQNHIKLAIADSSDGELDSAVFIEAGSLTSGTTVSTTLSGGGKTGATISVPPGTPVTDQATLAGANSGQATGTISYNVYSNANCTTAVSSGTPQTIATAGSPPASAAVTLNSPGTYYWQAVYSGDGANNTAKSTCGAEVETVAGGPDHTAPTCALTGVIAGPPKQVHVTVRDTGSGLDTISVTKHINSTVAVPAHAPGTTSPVVVTATKLNQSATSVIALQVTDEAGNVKNCDPVLTTVRSGHITHVRGLPHAEHTVRFSNTSKHAMTIRVAVNRHRVKVLHLAAKATRRITLHHLRRGDRNRVSLHATGARRASADVVIWNGSRLGG